jgi:hypothetical protein
MGEIRHLGTCVFSHVYTLFHAANIHTPWNNFCCMSLFLLFISPSKKSLLGFLVAISHTISIKFLFLCLIQLIFHTLHGWIWYFHIRHQFNIIFSCTSPNGALYFFPLSCSLVLYLNSAARHLLGNVFLCTTPTLSTPWAYVTIKQWSMYVQIEWEGECECERARRKDTVRGSIYSSVHCIRMKNSFGNWTIDHIIHATTPPQCHLAALIFMILMSKKMTSQKKLGEIKLVPYNKPPKQVTYVNNMQIKGDMWKKYIM